MGFAPHKNGSPYFIRENLRFFGAKTILALAKKGLNVYTLYSILK